MNKTAKSEVYSWRLSPELKMRLEEAARHRNRALSALLEQIANEWLDAHGAASDAAEQQRMRAALMACAGTLEGDGTSATNERVREVMGQYLEAKYGSRRAD